MILKSILGLVIGGGLGAVVGFWAQCSSGTCPLSSHWWVGAIVGAALGVYATAASKYGGCSCGCGVSPQQRQS